MKRKKGSPFLSRRVLVRAGIVMGVLSVLAAWIGYSVYKKFDPEHHALGCDKGDIVSMQIVGYLNEARVNSAQMTEMGMNEYADFFSCGSQVFLQSPRHTGKV